MKFTFKLDSLLIGGNFNLANTRPRNCCSFFVFIFSSILIHMQTARKKKKFTAGCGGYSDVNILPLVTAAKEVHLLDACLKIQRMFIGRLVVGLSARS